MFIMVRPALTVGTLNHSLEGKKSPNLFSVTASHNLCHNANILTCARIKNLRLFVNGIHTRDQDLSPVTVQKSTHTEVQIIPSF